MPNCHNVLFIIPPHGSYDSYIPKVPGQKKYFLTPPYGVLSIISYVNVNKNYNIEIFDCNKIILENLTNENIESLVYSLLKEKILNFKPSHIAISALFNTSFSHMIMVQQIKSYYKKAFICVGGGLATNLYKELFEAFPDIDAICFGEGEIAFKILLEAESLDDISTLSLAWITKKSISRKQIPMYNFVNNLDDIPIVDFSYIDIKKYNGRSYIDKSDTTKKIEVSIHTSRGCPFSCVFCANSRLHGKKIRMMSLQRVINTIKFYKEKYDMTILLIEDDHFLYNKTRALEILKFIKENNINVEFSNGIAVYKIDDDIAKGLVDAKVKLVTLAIESGSDYVLKNVINKPLNTKKIIKAINYLKKYKIRIHAFLVIGVPGETDEHRKESLDFIINLQLDWIYVFIATPIAGSRLYDICKENKYFINNSFDNHVVTKGNIKAPGIDPKDLEEYAYFMNIMVNFIENSNIKNNNYKIAEEYFLNVIRSYPKQAIAHLMLSKIYNKLDKSKVEFHYANYLKYYDEHIGIYNTSRHWKELIQNYFVR